MKRFLIAFGRFWYDFIVGDDWKIAAAVVLALAVTGGIMAIAHSALSSLTPITVIGGFIILAFFVVSLVLDLRPKGNR